MTASSRAKSISKTSTKKVTSKKAASRKRRTSSTPEPQEFPISNAMLRNMYDAMVESRIWAQSRNLVPVLSEATAVPAAIALRDGDLMAAPPDGRTLYPVTHRRVKVEALDPARVRKACIRARKDRHRAVVLVICMEDQFDSPGIQDLLAESSEALWPLICILPADRYFQASARITEMDVDGHDAVAMFRVISESIRRARNRRGPAIIHAHGATETQLPDPIGDPLVRFHRYLSAKGLSPQALHVVHKEAERT